MGSLFENRNAIFALRFLLAFSNLIAFLPRMLKILKMSTLLEQCLLKCGCVEHLHQNHLECLPKMQISVRSTVSLLKICLLGFFKDDSFQETKHSGKTFDLSSTCLKGI